MEQQLRTINIAGSTNMLHSSDKTEETFFSFFFFFSMLNTIFCVYGLAIFQSAAISSEEHIFKQHNNNIVSMYVWRISIILNAVEQCEWKLLMNKGSNVALHLGWWQRTKKEWKIKYTGSSNNCERKIVACVTLCYYVRRKKEEE